MAEKKQRSFRFIDVSVLGMVSLMAIGANLPESVQVNFDRRFLLAGLIAIVVVSLVKYLKFTLVLVVVTLAIGANLPQQIADDLGVDTRVMLFGLVAMIVVSLANHIFNLPVGTQAKPQKKKSDTHGGAALFGAIRKGRLASVRALLDRGVSANIRLKNGQTPLMYAAAMGFGDVVQLLLEHGADKNAKDSQGNLALDYAKERGFTRIVDILK